jgi:hypothetical protein
MSGKRTKVACSFELDGKIFRPISVSLGDLRATRIPSKPLLQVPGAREMLSSLTEIFCRELAVTDAMAERSSLFCISTWVGDALRLQPPAFVTGPNPLEGLCFLRLLHALCRRPVMLAGTRAAAWHSLSPLFETLLIFRPELGPKYLRNLLSCSNYRGIYIPGSHGVQELCRPKAVFVLDDAGQDDYFQRECIHFCLDGRSKYAALKDDRIEEIAAKFQPQLLAYRLWNWVKVYNAGTSKSTFSPAIRNVTSALAACVIADEQLQQRVISLFEDDDEEERAHLCTEPRLVLVEVLLALVHMGEQKLTMQQLASKMNALLRERGDFREYSPIEVGWKLRALSFVRRRRSQGRILFLGPDESRRIHEIARSLGVSEFHKPKGICHWCKELESTAGTKVM